jgi:Kef-type K+ transport system membrane component KefB
MSTLTVTGALLLQVAVILAACGLVGAVAARFQQPPVVGQMIAGILLGPSLLGLLLPQAQRFVFAPGTLAVTNGLGQLGVVLFMFLVGLELDFGLLRRDGRAGAAVAISGMAAPMLMGSLLAVAIAGDPRFFPAGQPSWVGVLFMGAATSVTAFPVMASIISEHGLLGTRMASLCLACGSFTDVAAWSLLAVALAGVAGSPVAAVTTLAGAVVFAVVVLAGVRPLLCRLGLVSDRTGASQRRLLSTLLVMLMVAAFLTEQIGIHPAFGAFLLGAALPRTAPIATAVGRLGPLASALLVPLYFAYTGLHTRIGLIDSPQLVLLTVAVVAVACLSKGGACWLAARLNGQSREDALAVGVLMNARGVVELVILTTGLERHVITPTLFAIMVTMTIVTTLLPSPVLLRLYGGRNVEQTAAVQAS